MNVASGLHYVKIMWAHSEIKLILFLRTNYYNPQTLLIRGIYMYMKEMRSLTEHIGA